MVAITSYRYSVLSLLQLVSHSNYVTCVYIFMRVPLIFHSSILVISITPLQVHYYLEALSTTAQILYRGFTPKRTSNFK